MLRRFGAVNIQRNKSFKILGDKDLSYFDKILDKGCVIPDPDQLEPHNQDWTKKFQGNSKLMLRPKSNEDVANILKYCN